MKKYFEGFLMALGNFSILPCPKNVWKEERKKYMLMTMSLVGLIIGIIQLGVFSILWNAMVRGVLIDNGFVIVSIMFIIPFVLTGFIHLDGFMDCCDAILSRRDIKERQRILKDSTVGAFAVISVVILFIISFSAMYSIIASSNPFLKLGVFAGIMTLVRAMASFDIMRITPIETSQYAYKHRENKDKKTERVTIIIGIVVSFAVTVFAQWMFGMGEACIIAILISALFQLLSRKVAVKNLGGINGDIGGFSIVIGELGGMLALGLTA